VVAVVQPGDLISEHGSQQVAVTMHLASLVTTGKSYFLVHIVCLVTAAAFPIVGTVQVGNIQSRVRKYLAKFRRLRFVKNTVDMKPRRNPLVESQVAAFKHKPKLLAIQPAGLMKSVIEFEEYLRLVTHRASDLFLDIRPGAKADLCRDHFARTKPAGQQVEEMDTMLDKNTAALAAIWDVMVIE
jgi:hypothetical protein